MEYLTCGIAVLVGVMLGLVGSGGAIITIPVFIYLLGFLPSTAITYSLFVVGVTTLAGSVNYWMKSHIDFRTTIIFFIPSFVFVMISRVWLLPLVPESFTMSEVVILSRDHVLLFFFALLMVISSISMIWRSRHAVVTEKALPRPAKNLLLFLIGAVVGILTGLVGSGGGFLIVPSMVLFAGIPMKHAIGSSLMIVGINSLIGFSADLVSGILLDWSFLVLFCSFALAGLSAGTFLSGKMDGNRLKPVFGWITLLIGVFIVCTEVIGWQR